jgi:hypothetical protein
MPVLTVLGLLAVVVGLPFFALATTGPLLQRYFTATTHPHAKRPWFLYAASNAGSFVALLSYPFLIEPHKTLKQQSLLWAYTYVLFVLLTASCIVLMHRFYSNTVPTPKVLAKGIVRPVQRVKWLFLAFVPSSLMLGVTTYITTNIAAVPLLWIIPLSLYLITFVIAFGSKDPAEIARLLTPFAAAGLFATAIVGAFNFYMPVIFLVGFYLAVFVVIALVSHSWLSANKPKPYHLTEFYLWVAIGGVLGGLFNSIVAPFIFNDVYELPIVLLLAALLLLKSTRPRLLKKRLSAFILIPPLLYFFVYVANKHQLLGINLIPLVAILVIPLFLILILLWRPKLIPLFGIGMVPILVIPIIVMANQHSMYDKRTFYSVLKVKDQTNVHFLYSGTIIHGAQSLNPALAKEPTTYYTKAGPLGDIVNLCRQLTHCHSMASVGLGVGTLAAYGQTGDTITFYELDPADISLARDSRYFTYINNSAATVKTIAGDGRLSLEKDKTKYDLLIIDAFSSDSIPTNLLTQEAMQLYQSRLTPHGLIAMNITNDNINLEPVIHAEQQALHMNGLLRNDPGGGSSFLHFGSKWVLLSNSSINAVPNRQLWQPLGGRTVRAWTDNYSNILDVL